MLHTSLYVQCYFNKTQKSQYKQTREKGKRKKKYTNRKKTRLSKTRSINILTYDMTISDENSENLFQPKWDAIDERTSDNHKQDSRFFNFFNSEQETHIFFLSCYILVDIMKSNNYCWLVKLTVKRGTLLKKWSDLCCVLPWVVCLAFSLSNHLITLHYLMTHKTLKRG